MNIQRWKTFSKREQMGHIAAEVLRAQYAEEKGDEATTRAILERVLELVDASLGDKQWRGEFLQLMTLRDEIARRYIGQKVSLQNLYAAF